MERDPYKIPYNELIEDHRRDLKPPDLWKVVFLDDDYTPKDFVVEILVSLFHKPPIEATKIMLNIHKKGKGVVGLYPYDIGRTKVAQTISKAREREYPLRSILEKA